MEISMNMSEMSPKSKSIVQCDFKKFIIRY